MAYDIIFNPLTIRNMTLRNRIVMPPMGTNFANLDGSFKDVHYRYYEQRAKGGTGLITLENVCIDFPFGSNGTTQLRIDNDQYLPGMWEFNERMHAHGAMTSVQLNHAGASAFPGRLNGELPISASNVPSKTGGNIPRSMTIDEIHHAIKKYGEAADRAIRAGFDCVEIHAGHSYLLSRFLSPIYNKRTDEFGGSAENRARLTRMVIDEIRTSIGPHYPIVLRFSADELVEGANTLEDTLEILDYLVDEVDVLNVSAALNDSIQYQIDKMDLADGWRAYMAEAVKKKYPDKVVMTSGNIRSPEVAADILTSGKADLLGMGRGLIADPNWANKVRLGQTHLLRKCISCNIGCADHRIAKARPIRCTLNPDLFNEDSHFDVTLENPVNVVVVGGGSAGLEAASTAAEIGANVTLFEAKDYLGGLARDIARLPEKNRINDFADYLIARAEGLENLNIQLNKKATAAAVRALNPDVIVNATGSVPLLPPIDGLSEQLSKENRRVFTIFDMLYGMENFQETEGKSIVIVGGGAVGLDVMEYYALRGAKSITMVEMQDAVGKDLDLVTKVSMMNIAKKHGVMLKTHTKLTKVEDSSFRVATKEGKEEVLEFDLGFVCLGMKSNTPVLDELKNLGVEVVNIGDSKRARKLMDGTREGRDVVNVIQRVSKEKSLKVGI